MFFAWEETLSPSIRPAERRGNHISTVCIDQVRNRNTYLPNFVPRANVKIPHRYE